LGLIRLCSSSLVAVHLAHASLVRGSIDGGLSAGTNLMLLPSTSQNLSSLGSLSSSGRCKTLDADADGYGRGEGCAVIVTGFVDGGSRAAARGPSPSSTDAISEGLDVETAHYIDNVTDALDVEPLAYLDGCECNQDGRSSSLTAPNGPAQSALISTMLSRAGVPSGHVALMHLHGTGTPLGDPIEVGALLKVFPGPSVHGLVSLKASIGHTEGTAGAHGVAGVIACLSQESLLGFHALRNVNQYVGRLLEESPAAPVMARQPQGLASTGAGRGARTGHQTVSSYGMSGTNACAVLRGVSNRAVSVPRGGGPPALDGRRTVWPCPVAVAISVASIRSSTVQFEYRLGPGTSYLSDHVVGGRSIMPGAGMFFMSTTCVSLAFSRPCLLMQASITTPMPLESVEVVSVDVIVSRGDVTVGARGPGRAARRVTSCRARVGRVGAVDAVDAVIRGQARSRSMITPKRCWHLGHVLWPAPAPAPGGPSTWGRAGAPGGGHLGARPVRLRHARAGSRDSGRSIRRLGWTVPFTWGQPRRISAVRTGRERSLPSSASRSPSRRPRCTPW
jgi:hypothetical protein